MGGEEKLQRESNKGTSQGTDVGADLIKDEPVVLQQTGLCAFDTRS